MCSWCIYSKSLCYNLKFSVGVFWCLPCFVKNMSSFCPFFICSIINSYVNIQYSDFIILPLHSCLSPNTTGNPPPFQPLPVSSRAPSVSINHYRIKNLTGRPVPVRNNLTNLFVRFHLLLLSHSTWLLILSRLMRLRRKQNLRLWTDVSITSKVGLYRSLHRFYGDHP